MHKTLLFDQINFFDRLPTQNFTLTYGLSDFIFQPNEFINTNSIDNKLKKSLRKFLRLL